MSIREVIATVNAMEADGVFERYAIGATFYTDLETIPARVFTAEHLAAIALQTGRAKDKSRLLQFIDASAIDLERFEAIITRHGLGSAWQRFQSLIGAEAP